MGYFRTKNKKEHHHGIVIPENVRYYAAIENRP